MKRTLTFCGLCVWLLLFGSVASARLIAFPREEPTPHLTLQPPMLEITPGENALFHDAVLAPDGQSIYALRSDDVVNVWAMAVYYWTFLLAFVTGAVFLFIFARTARRLWRERGIKRGQPMCRRCRYLLTGLSSSTCPECGVELSNANRTVARKLTLRSAFAITMTLSMFIAAAVLTRLDLPRYGRISEWFAWDSAWLADRLHEWDRMYLMQRTEFALPIYALEQRSLQTGEMLRCLEWRRVSRDGDDEAVRLRGVFYIAYSSTWTGGPRMQFIHCADESLLAYAATDQNRNQSQVRIFDLAQGRRIETRTLASALRNAPRLGRDGVIYTGVAGRHTLVGYAGDQSDQFFDKEPAGLGRFEFREAQVGIGQSEPRFEYHFVATVKPQPTQTMLPGEDLLVKDTRTGEWIARFDVADDWSHSIRVNHDGTRVLVTHESGRRLQYFDLSDVIPTSESR